MSVYKRRMEEATRNLKVNCAKHTVEYESGTLGGEPVELLTWYTPGTGFYLMRFMAVGPRLIVTGDIREGIYCRAPGLRWWASLNLQYFAEKCTASAKGSPPWEWDEEECLAYAKELIRESMRDDGERGLWRRFKDLGGPDAAAYEQSWYDFLHAHGTEFFGQDWWEMRFGKVISFDTAYHLAGLKLAVAQLQPAEVAA